MQEQIIFEEVKEPSDKWPLYFKREEWYWKWHWNRELGKNRQFKNTSAGENHYEVNKWIAR